MNLEIICPKCNLSMDRGYIPATSESYGRSKWAPGAPTRGLFGAIVAPSQTTPIAAFRCKGCGLLQFYAIDAP